jgi:phage-related holin
MEMILLLMSFAFLGGAIKYVDQAYDESAFSIRSANVLAVLAGLLMGFLMAADSPFSTAFFISMLISLSVAKKVDNLAFVAGSLIAVASFILLSSQYSISILIMPIVIFLATGLLDEIADGVAHKRELTGWAERIITYRPFSDFAMVGMILLGWFSWVCLLLYLCFTAAYMVVEFVSMNGLRVPDRLRLWGN